MLVAHAATPRLHRSNRHRRRLHPDSLGRADRPRARAADRHRRRSRLLPFPQCRQPGHPLHRRSSRRSGWRLCGERPERPYRPSHVCTLLGDWTVEGEPPVTLKAGDRVLVIGDSVDADGVRWLAVGLEDDPSYYARRLTVGWAAAGTASDPWIDTDETGPCTSSRRLPTSAPCQASSAWAATAMRHWRSTPTKPDILEVSAACVWLSLRCRVADVRQHQLQLGQC